MSRRAAPRRRTDVHHGGPTPAAAKAHADAGANAGPNAGENAGANAGANASANAGANAFTGAPTVIETESWAEAGIQAEAASGRGADTAGDSAPAVNPFDIRPSKTRLKRKAHDLQALGVQLTELSDARLDHIDMPEPLRDALADYRRTKSFEGKRRQLQYIGKLMHNADEAALREAVAAATLGSAQNTLALHQAEQWRLALITEDEAMTRWLHEHPQTDAQQLRSLVRAARRDVAGLKPEDRQPRSSRELFQFLRPLLAS